MTAATQQIRTSTGVHTHQCLKALQKPYVRRPRRSAAGCAASPWPCASGGPAAPRIEPSSIDRGSKGRLLPRTGPWPPNSSTSPCVWRDWPSGWSEGGRDAAGGPGSTRWGRSCPQPAKHILAKDGEEDETGSTQGVWLGLTPQAKEQK